VDSPAGNKMMMYWPVIVLPTAIPAGAAGFSPGVRRKPPAFRQELNG